MSFVSFFLMIRPHPSSIRPATLFPSTSRFRARQAEEETLAVQDLTLDFQEGEFVAVVGPSGCGKSTLMKLVTGLLEPSNGLITVGGKPVRGAIQGVGMAFQNSSLLPWRSTLDNVMLQIGRAACRERVCQYV